MKLIQQGKSKSCERQDCLHIKDDWGALRFPVDGKIGRPVNVLLFISVVWENLLGWMIKVTQCRNTIFKSYSLLRYLDIIIYSPMAFYVWLLNSTFYSMYSNLIYIILLYTDACVNKGLKNVDSCILNIETVTTRLYQTFNLCIALHFT